MFKKRSSVRKTQTAQAHRRTSRSGRTRRRLLPDAAESTPDPKLLLAERDQERRDVVLLLLRHDELGVARVEEGVAFIKLHGKPQVRELQRATRKRRDRVSDRVVVEDRGLAQREELRRREAPAVCW